MERRGGGGVNRLLGIIEPAMTVGSAIAAEVPALAVGLASLNTVEDRQRPFSEAVAAADEVRDMLTYNPRSMEGQAGMQSLINSVSQLADTVGLDTAFQVLNEEIIPRVQSTLGEDAARELGSMVMMIPAVRRLPMDTASRMQRAKEMGFDDEPLYIGSTFDIEELDLEKMDPESYFGRAIYTTTSPDDASINYAGEGPDLTNKIQLRAERIADETDRDYNDPEVLQQARSEVKGENLGVIYPMMGRSEKVFDIRTYGDNPTLSYKQPEMDFKDYLDEAKDDLYYRGTSESDFDTKAEFDEVLEDRARELAFDDSLDLLPEGELVDFLEALQRDSRVSNEDYKQLVQDIGMRAFDNEGISAQDLNRVMRKANIESFLDGKLLNFDVFRNALQEAGFDTIKMDADTFKMEGVEGAEHRIFLKPEQLRSINAEFDPEKKDSSNILSSILDQRFRNIA
jgi:hypothetical protein